MQHDGSDEPAEYSVISMPHNGSDEPLEQQTAVEDLVSTVDAIAEVAIGVDGGSLGWAEAALQSRESPSRPLVTDSDVERACAVEASADAEVELHNREGSDVVDDIADADVDVPLNMDGAKSPMSDVADALRNQLDGAKHSGRLPMATGVASSIRAGSGSPVERRMASEWESHSPTPGGTTEPDTHTPERSASRMSQGASRNSNRGGGSRLSMRGASRNQTPTDWQQTKPLTEEQQQQLMRRLWKSDELIKQLKHIVKAQHVKIEELRDKVVHLERPIGTRVDNILAEMEMKDVAIIKQDNEELQQRVNRLQHDSAKHKSENDTLRKVNKRLKTMIGQESNGPAPLQLHSIVPNSLPKLSGTAPLQLFQTRPDSIDDMSTWRSIQLSSIDAGLSLDASSAKSARLPLSASFSEDLNGLHSGGNNSISPPGSPKSTQLSATKGSGTLRSSGRGNYASERSASPQWDQSARSVASTQSLPTFSKLSRLHNVMPMFWRKSLETPTAVVRALVEIAARLLSDRMGIQVTCYLLDPWLKQDVVERTIVANPNAPPPALFYLGQGKTQLQVLHQEGVSPEPPRFADLHSLPCRKTRRALAMSLQMPTTHRVMAVLQAHITETNTRKQSTSKAAPKVLKNIIGDRHEEQKDVEGFTDSQSMCLQLVCNVAGGLLEQLERLQEKEIVLERMRGCVDVAVVVNKARSLPDFEQRVKHMLGNFFAVHIVRVLFYDDDSEQLLVSPAQMAQTRRKECLQLSLDKGIVGLVARRQQVQHVSDISQHPYVDALADGLERSGKPINPQAEMLCGPMVVDFDAGGKLVGVVQLLDRVKVKRNAAKAPGSDSSKEWGLEDQKLFQQLLKVCAHCAWRTMQVQTLSAQSEGTPGGLARMIAG